MKYILIELQVQNGEYRYEMKSVHITKCKDVMYAGQRHAGSFYGNRTGRSDEWWEFNGCEVAVRLYSVTEITKEEFAILNKHL